MVKNATHSWILIAIGVNQTRVVMKMDIQSGGIFGFLMLPIIKFQMENLVDDITSDFKYYAEKAESNKKASKLKGRQTKKVQSLRLYFFCFVTISSAVNFFVLVSC